MAIKLDLDCRGVAVKGAYIKISSLSIDNESKSISCWLTMSSSKSEKSLPLDIQSQFSGIPMVNGSDPLEVAYDYIMKTKDYQNSVRVD